MFILKNCIKGNYLQHVRSYSFLVTIALIIYLTFSFIPSENANYSTIRFGSYTGVYNTAWIGFVTAIMSSVFLSLFGFFLINGSIKKDIDTRIGLIIGTTKISNLVYIFTKVFSSFLILFTLLLIAFFTSIGLFFLYGKSFDFCFFDFSRPYMLIAIPSLLIIVNFSIILEIIFPKKVLIQYGIFFIVFVAAIFSSTNSENSKIDLFGIQEPTRFIEQQIKEKHHTTHTQLVIGVVSREKELENITTISTPLFSNTYILNRTLLVIFSFILVYLASLFFHRFNIKERERSTTQKQVDQMINSSTFKFKKDASVIHESSKLFPLIFIELLMIFRKNPKWVWFLTFVSILMMLFLPTDISHSYILPLTWFLQISIWSNLVTKDETFRTHYFTNSSYKPLQRIFISRIFSGIILALLIALPLIIRNSINFELMQVINIVLGALFISLLAVFFGVITKGNKLFEIVFFFLIYSNINLVPITDYFGAINNSTLYTFIMSVLVFLLFLSSYFIKKMSHE